MLSIIYSIITAKIQLCVQHPNSVIPAHAGIHFDFKDYAIKICKLNHAFSIK